MAPVQPFIEPSIDSRRLSRTGEIAAALGIGIALAVGWAMAETRGLLPLSGVFATVVGVGLMLRRRPTCALLVTSAIVLIAKLLLVADHEVVAVQSDAWSYVSMGGSEAPWSLLGASPGYPLWLWVCMHLGVPQRIAIEVVFFCASALWAAGTGSRFGGTVGYAAVLAATVLSPSTYFMFDQALSDGLSAALTLAALGATSYVLTAERQRRQWLGLVVLGLLLGFMELTRKESVLVYGGMLLLFVALIVWAIVMEARPWRIAVGSAMFKTFVVGLCCVAVILPVVWIHEHELGVSALSIAELPSHTGLLTRLASIDDGEPGIRFVPVRQEAIALAFRNSPTLARFEPVVDARDNPYRKESERVLALPGEIGAGWIWHIFNAAAPMVGIKTAAKLDATYRQVNAELDASFASGTLKKRFVLHPLIGATPSVWLPFLPAGIGHVLDAATIKSKPPIDQAFELELFNRVCVRRVSLIPDPDGSVQGWAYASRGQLGQVEVLGPANAAGQMPDPILARRVDRPDVQAAFRREGVVMPLDVGFVTRIPVARVRDNRLRFQLDGKSFMTTAPFETNRVATIDTATSGGRIVYAFDALPQPVARDLSGWRMQAIFAAIDAYDSPLFWSVVAAGTLTTLLLSFVGTHASRRERVVRQLVMFTLASWMIARLMLYAVVDAAGWGAEPRYVQLAGIIAVTLLVLSIITLAQRAAAAVLRKGTAGARNGQIVTTSA